jgi:hypothetical protein
MLMEIVVIAAAYVAGTVSPAIGRKLKAELAKGEADVKADASKVETAAKADVAKKL